MGRIEQDGDRFRCITCGSSGTGKPESICGCGMHLGRKVSSEKQVARQKARPRQAFHCMPNPKKTDVSPADILIGFGDEPLRSGPAA
jgi:hypothetical protein